MPATSKAQQHLFAAAEHGATFPKAQALRQSLDTKTLHDFAATPSKNLPPRAPQGLQRLAGLKD